MGIQVKDSLVDFEIRPLVKKLNDLPFLQSRSSCSGWSPLKEGDGTSDGVNRKWKGSPYLSIWSLEDEEALGKFLPYILKRMIFDIRSSEFRKNYQGIQDYKKFLSLVDYGEDEDQILFVGMEFRDEKSLMNFYIANKSSEQVDKIFKLFSIVVDDYIKTRK